MRTQSCSQDVAREHKFPREGCLQHDVKKSEEDGPKEGVQTGQRTFSRCLLQDAGEQTHPTAQEAVRILDKMVGPQKAMIEDKVLTDFKDLERSRSQTCVANVSTRKWKSGKMSDA